MAPARTTPAATITRGYINVTLDDLAFAVRHTRTRCVHESPYPEPTASGQQINIYDAKSRLSRLITDIQHTGHGVIIARNGRPVAELAPLRSIL